MFVPLKQRKTKTTDPWMKSRKVLIATAYRDLAEHGYLENMHEINWRIFCRYRNKLKSIIRNERTRILTSKFKNSSDSQLWNRLRNMGCTKDYNSMEPLNVEEFNKSCLMPALHYSNSASF